MSAVVDRALAAAAAHDYGGAETRALLRMAMDADHDSGENCVTGLSRIHQAAGYSDDPKRPTNYKTARRTVKRFEGDGVLRADLDVSGIGRLFTVCPIADWSGAIATNTAIGRKLAMWLARHPTPDAGTSGVNVAATPDTQTSGVNGSTPDTTPDTTPDAFTSDDQRTNGPTSLSFN